MVGDIYYWLHQPPATLIRWICLPLLVLGLCLAISPILKSQGKQPPGPKGWPIVGNTYDLLRCNGYYLPLFRAWSKQYGPITQFTLGFDKHVIVSDHKIARELFVQRGSKYGDRFVPHAAEWATMNQNPALRKKDDGWRRERAFIHSAVSITANQKYRSVMDQEANITLSRLIQDPESSKDQLKRFAYSVLTKTLMGFPVTSATDPFILAEEHFLFKIFASYRLDIFPSNIFSVLQRLPPWLIPNMSTMEKLRKDNLEHMLKLQSRIESNVTDGTAGDSIYKHFLTNRQDYSITDEELAFTYQAIIGAGVTGPYETVLTALTLLAEYPTWQERLHADIDQAVQDRLPGFQDIPNLPVVRAIIKEALRYRGALNDPGLPRKLTEDDMYEGYLFKKGTTFHMNFSTILTDRELYPDGELFNPARYLEPSFPTYKEPLTVYPNCQNLAAFGYGRRACPGIDFAEQTCSIVLLKLCWAFRILPSHSEEGKGSSRSNIMDWNFRMQIRGNGHAALVKQVLSTGS